MSSKMDNKSNIKVMLDDSNVGSDNEDFYYSSDNIDYDSESDFEKELKEPKEPPVKKVANIMNNILSNKNDTILSKVKNKMERKERLSKTFSEKVNLKQEWINKGRIKANMEHDHSKEKKLKIIGTQGVIQLFRTLEKHRMELRSDLKQTSSTNERDKVFERHGLQSFMNLLNKKEDRIKTEECVKNERELF